MQALIFDFDGLILDTETPEFEIWTEVFNEHGMEIPPGYWATFIGRGAEQEMERPAALLARLTETFKDSPALHEERRERVRARIAIETARPGVPELLEDARRAEVPIGIASSSPHIWVDNLLKKLGLFPAFNAIVCADDVERAKPFPDLYLRVCEELRVEPRQCVALEDSPNGLAAAKAAGLFSVVVPNSVTALLDVSMADWRTDSLAGVTVADLDHQFLGASRRGVLQ